MLDKCPSEKEIISLVGKPLYNIWLSLTESIDAKYEMERLWNSGGKMWKYEYKYRRGGKTLCALYARENCIGFMVVFGQEVRGTFAACRDSYSKETQKVYDEEQTDRDGKWIMFEPKDSSLFDDFIKILSIKRKPNKK